MYLIRWPKFKNINNMIFAVKFIDTRKYKYFQHIIAKKLYHQIKLVCAYYILIQNHLF